MKAIALPATGLLMAALMGLLWAPPAAKADLTAQTPVRFELTLSNPAGEPVFTPNQLEFQSGQLTVLTIRNNSPKSYYFGSQGMADAIYTRKVAVVDQTSGKPLAEVYGPVRRVEVYPGQALEWWFVPVRAGTFDDGVSRRSETAAGMRATIVIR